MALCFALEDMPVPMAYATFRIIRDCNQAFADLFELTPADIVNRSFSHLYPEVSDFVRIGELWQVAFSNSPSFYDERLMQTAGGRQFWCSVHGHTLTPSDPLMRATYCFQPISRPADLEDAPLTARQRQILALVAQGHTNAEIATVLHLSKRTVESHRARLMRQVGVNNTAQLIAWFSLRSR